MDIRLLTIEKFMPLEDEKGQRAKHDDERTSLREIAARAAK